MVGDQLCFSQNKITRNISIYECDLLATDTTKSDIVLAYEIISFYLSKCTLEQT